MELLLFDKARTQLRCLRASPPRASAEKRIGTLGAAGWGLIGCIR